jgi:hypothetical protein
MSAILLARKSVLALAMIFMVGTAQAQTVIHLGVNSGIGTSPGQSVGASAFAGGAGAFSGKLNSSVLPFRGVPSYPFFPGSAFPSIRGSEPIAAGVPATGLPAIGVSANDLFSTTYGYPLGAEEAGAFGAAVNAAPATETGVTAGTATTGEIPAIPAATPGVLGTEGVLLAPTAALPVATANLEIARLPVSAAPSRTAAPAGPAKPRPDLQEIIDRSSSLSQADSIRVLSDGARVILRGHVVSDSDRILAEALLRLSPGVKQVQNDLTIGPAGS